MSGVKPNSSIERSRGRERDKQLFAVYNNQMRVSDDDFRLYGIPEATNDE